MRLKIHTYNLELKNPFTISRGTRTHIPSLIVELIYNGKSGFGEATANSYYETEIDELVLGLENYRHCVEIEPTLIPEKFWMEMYPYFKDKMFLLCALDEAYHDLYTKLKGIKLYEYWKFKPSTTIKSNYTIGIDSIANMVSKMKAVKSPIYKIKLGTENDVDIVKELRQHSDAIFRIDANSAWTVAETLKNAIAFKKLGVQFIEQPLPAEDWEGAKNVYENTVLPIIADESCILEEDVAKCATVFNGINVKLMKCGGLTPAKRMLEKATQLGLKKMVGCMIESSVGISAIAHLTPILDYVDMDGAILLKKDIATGVKLQNGVIRFSENYGTGAALL
jgi:L-alanine-DL-glutamate epimerase-like enolase superfamily enzyme